MNLGVTFESLRNLFFLFYILFSLVFSFDISCTPSLLSLSLTSVCVYSPSNATVTAVGVYNGDGVGLISGGSGIVTFTPSLSDVVMMSVRVGNETKVCCWVGWFVMVEDECYRGGNARSKFFASLSSKYFSKYSF